MRKNIRHWIVGCLDTLILLVLLAVAVMTFLLLFATFDWRLDIARSFEPLYFAATLISFIYIAVRRKWRTATLGFLLTTFHGWSIVPYIPLPHAKPPDQILRIMTANLQWDSNNSGRFLEVVRQEMPDILALQEVTPAHQAYLTQLHTEYPFHVEHVRESVLGVALLSKIPLYDTQRFSLTRGVYATLLADADWNGERISIMVTHTVPPFNSEWSAQRDAQLAKIPSALGKGQSTAILVGDLNATMWSPPVIRMSRQAGLNNARQGFGIIPTYSSRLPIIPIDHCFYRGNLQTIQCRRGPFTGSDHLPLIVEFTSKSPLGG